MNTSRMKNLATIIVVALCTTIAAPAARAGTADGYVQDGLLACWDGIENAGSGIHNSSATKWRDLVAGREFSLIGVTVADDRMVFTGSNSSRGDLNEADTAATFNMASNGTLEVVYASETGSGNQFILQSTLASGHLLTIWSGDKLLVSNGQGNRAPSFSFTSGAQTNSVTIIYTSAKPTAGYANGDSLSTSDDNYWGDPNSKTTIGTRSSTTGQNYFKGAIYCIRVYSRQLSAEEIAANRALDVRRFLQGNPIDDVLDISSSSSACSTPSPAYGGHLGLVEGQQVAVSCGQSPWTNAAQTESFACSGWKLYDEAGNLLSSGPETSFTYTHPNPAAYRRLEWQWVGSSSCYVKDGLLAIWDGVEQNGSTAWKDLVAGRAFILDSVSIADDRMVFAGSDSSYGELNEADTAATFNMAANGTLEVVYASDTGTGNQIILQSTAASGNAMSINSGTKIIATSGSANSSPTFMYTSGTATNSVSVRYASAMAINAYANGNALPPTSNNYWGDVNEKTTIGTRSTRGSNHFKGAIYCIRVYDRRLTPAEIALNHAIDARRFQEGNHLLLDDVLAVSSTSETCSTPSPAYGLRSGLSAGQQVVVSCGASPWSNAAQTVSFVCSGWKLYDEAGNELSSGTGTSFTYTHPDPAAYRRLEWQWGVVPIDNYTDLTNAVANAATGDTIKLKAGTINVTSTITITKGITLSGGWTDDSTRADGAVTVLDGGDSADCKQVLYVRANAAEGLVTLDSLCLTHGYVRGLQQGIPASSPKDNCDLAITNCQFVANGSASDGGDDGNGRGRGAYLNMDGGSRNPVVTIKDSLFAGNIITIPSSKGPYGGGLYAFKLSSLVVENCDFITNGVPFSVAGNGHSPSSTPCNSGFFGTAIYVNGVPTAISDCRFLGNFAREGSTVGFSGACGGSSISNCLFAANQHNKIAWSNKTFGTINVNMSAASDTLEISGCTIAYNASGSELVAAGLTVLTGTVNVRDSILFGNRVGSGSTVGSDIMTGDNGTVNLAYSLVTGSSDAYMSGSVVAGTGVIYGDPLFVTDDATVLGKMTFNTSKAYFDPSKTTQEETVGFDLHLRSKVGYFLNDGTLVENGTESSPAIDAADPASDFSREGDPNGSRRNLGFYGNTAEASRSRLVSAEIESVTISFPNGYSKPDVAVTLADSEDAYTAEIVLYSGIEGAMPDGWTWTNYVHGAAQGSTSILSPNEYLTAGDTYSIRVEAYVIGTAAVSEQSTAVVTGTIPPWVGHGGGATVVHVREGADAKMDGSDWANAFPDIKSALMAVTADKTEMWIAGNFVYDSTPGTLNLAGPLTIRGGFTGLEDTAAARPAGSSATLDGAGSFDLLSIGNGAGFDLVVERILFTRATSWGVSKTGAGDATFRDCRFLDNGGRAKYYTGGALKLTGAGAVVTVENCLFDGNLSSREYASSQQYVAAIGSALSATSLGRLVLVDTSFVTNGIDIADGAVNPFGPVSTGPDGVALKADASPVVARNCRFVGNTAHVWEQSGIVTLVGACDGSAFTNCLFAGNQTPCSYTRVSGNNQYSKYAGAVSMRLSNAAQTVDFSQCTIAYNLDDSVTGGGGIDVRGGTANIVNSILFGNQRGPGSSGGADICVRTNAVLNLSYSLVTADDASRISCDEGGTIATNGVIYGDPLLMTDRATYESWTVTNRWWGASGLDYIYNVASNATDLCAINAHLRSKTGYTDETTGELVRTPRVMSPAIDAGREGTPYADEPSPNGRRANLGFYGNTPYASRSESSGFIYIVR